MNLHYRMPLKRRHAAVYVLVAALCVLVLVSLGRAVRLAPLPEPETTQPQPLLVPELDPGRVQLWEAVRVVERDPFHTDRQPPFERFLLPDESVASMGPGPTRSAPNRLELVGTAVSEGSGGFAMCRLGSGAPVILKIGDELGGLTLQTLSRGEATFARRDGTVVTLTVPGRGLEPSSGQPGITGGGI